MSTEGRRRTEEVFLPLPAPRDQLEPTTQFRTTWLVSSQNTLRERGAYERYFAHLPDEHRDALASMLVGAWAPIEVAIAHYQACDALGFTAAEQLEIGRAVTERLKGTLLTTTVRLATHAGADLWTILGAFHRLWDRMFVGGGAAVYKLGPKETRVEILGCSLASIPYFRNGLQGVLHGIGELFCQKLYVSEVTRASSESTIVYRGSWV